MEHRWQYCIIPVFAPVTDRVVAVEGVVLLVVVVAGAVDDDDDAAD